jgi:hypothetical protein
MLVAVCAVLGRAWAAEPADNNGVAMWPRWRLRVPPLDSLGFRRWS